MFKEKTIRLFRSLKKNLRSVLLLWLPAGVVIAVLAFVFLSVALSKDSSFYTCGQMLTRCAGESPSLVQTTKCAYKTAWCDVTVLWDKLNGKKFPDLPGLPVVDEKADQELFDKLTSDEFLDQRFEELEQEEEKNPRETGLPPKEQLKEYMEKIRQERIVFEKEQEEKRKAFSVERENESVNNNLTGKTAK